MTSVTSYTNKEGKKLYKVAIYLGVNPLTGKEERTTRRGFNNKIAASKAATAIKYEYDNGTFKLNAKKNISYTFQEIYEKWEIQYKNTILPSTFTKTQRLFRNHILPEFGHYNLTSITVDMCQAFINKKAQELKAFSSLKDYTSKVFQFAIARDFILKDPMSQIIKPQYYGKKNVVDEDELFKGNYYTKEELEHFLECAKNNINDENKMKFTLFFLLSHTGLRKGEALALKWDDIDLVTGFIRVNKALSYSEENKVHISKTKNKKSRSFYIDSDTLNILNEWKKSQAKTLIRRGLKSKKNHQLIFMNTQNEYLNPSSTSIWINKIQEHNNLKKITTHGLRHTHCTLLFEAELSSREVMDRLGHQDIRITMNIYDHISNDTRLEVSIKFKKYMDSSKPSTAS